jgi:hypothetical protein
MSLHPPQMPFTMQMPPPVYDITLSGAVFTAYAKVNPLKLQDLNKGSYWTQTFKFLSALHEVLGHPTHEMNLRNIKTDNYYFLVKMCVDFSFTVPEIITIRNDKESKVCKIIANDLLNTGAIPFYITRLSLQGWGPLPSTNVPMGWMTKIAI